VNESQKRQMFAALGLGALILLAVKAPQEYATFALVASLVGGATLILWVSSGAGGADSDLLFLAIRKAQEGERIEIPAGADASTRRLLEEVDRLSKAHVSSGEATKLLRQEVSQSTFSIEDAARSLQDLTSQQAKSNEETIQSVSEMASASTKLSAHVETLIRTTEDSSSSVLEMTATQEAVSGRVLELSGSVRETVGSIEDMSYAIKEVARNVDGLSLNAEETSSSMNEMDVSIDQVQSNANETARLSEEVTQDAERGVDAILKTTGEISRIRESSREAVSVIANLGSRIDAIGQIVNVIDDVAEQTNLLALNAAIIAAQAGEQGKGFAVVADEIKDLADRAATSTREITDLIKMVQQESKNAISAVERGAINVDRGVEVSNEAERALKKILESSQKSTNMVRAIARATVEQAKGSKQVTDSIGRIAQTVQQIAAATAQQARGSEVIMKSADKMRTITQHVEQSSQEQNRGAKQIAGAIETMAGMIHAMADTQKGQQQGSEKLSLALGRSRETTVIQQEQVRKLTEALARMRNGR
jgi:methyl-accepting chemotaxis protein